MSARRARLRRRNGVIKLPCPLRAGRTSPGKREEPLQDHGVSSSLFQNPAKLHLTLGTLVLLNEQEIRKACDLLQRCKEDFVDQIAGGKPLTVEVAGVEYMNDDPAMTDVLYAKVHMKDGSDRLQVIADRLVERFVASGLMLKEWDRVKLHATVMNTLFRKDPSALRELLLRRGAAGLGAAFPEVLLGRLRLLRHVRPAGLLLRRQGGCRGGRALPAEARGSCAKCGLIGREFWTGTGELRAGVPFGSTKARCVSLQLCLPSLQGETGSFRLLSPSVPKSWLLGGCRLFVFQENNSKNRCRWLLGHRRRFSLAFFQKKEVCS
ncbi:activating signal cointegrator 1 complex subunit 1 isoform 3-T7 [Chlamydotis macqueenii]